MALAFVVPVLLSKMAAALVLAVIVGGLVWMAWESFAFLALFVVVVVGLAALMIWALQTLGVR